MSHVPDAHDAIVVLGANVKHDLTPSEALQRRLALALARYLARPVPIICCGAQGRDEPCCEGDFMCRWLVQNGVPEGDIIAETGSYDTLQNIANAKAIMVTRGLGRALVVTSDYHLPRALAICRRYGLTAIGAGSKSSPSLRRKNNAREVLAWGKFFLTVGPELIARAVHHLRCRR